MCEGESETVQVKVPKVILEILKALRFSVQEYLENTIIEGFRAD